MNVVGSECTASACWSTRLCQVKELAQTSSWSGVEALLDQVDSCHCVESVLQQAVREQQWGCVVKLSPHCSVQQRSELVLQLVAHGQWPEVLQLLKQPVTSEAVKTVVEHAVKEGQWGWVKEVLEVDVCGLKADWLCECAVQQQQWDVVLHLVDMGIQSVLRNCILQSAMAQCQLSCTAKLMELGVSKRCREDSVREQIASGHYDFILQMVKRVRDPDLVDFVVRESMQQNQWQLVSELVKVRLSVTQMESVCDEAVACRQWTLALQLLRDGVSPSEWIVSELFRNNMAQSLVDLFPAGTVSEGLKGLLLMAAIRHGQGDFTLHILQRESVSDAHLMEVIKYAVHLLDKDILLKLLRHSPRCRRVFKQKFNQQDWKDSLQPVESECDGTDGGEICWIFHTLNDGGEKDLALYMAANNTIDTSLIGDFCRNEWDNFDLKKVKFRYALRKLYECDRRDYCEFVEDLYEGIQTTMADRSFLFRQVIRFGVYHLAVSLSEHGVQRKDLRFAVPWLLSSEHENVLSAICLKLHTKDRKWLEQYVVRFTMREYFKQKSDSSLESFIGQFRSCYDKTFTRQIFRKAIRKSVKFDCANCFVALCKCQFAFSMTQSKQKDCCFAYTSALTGGRYHFISKVCKEKIAEERDFSLGELLLLINIVFETKAWLALPCLSAGVESVSDPASKILETCLQKMLSDQETWPGIAPALDQWIKDVPFGLVDHLVDSITCIKLTIVQEHWLFSLSSMTQWCVENGHANTAFLLALITEDWQLAEIIVNTQTSLDLHQRFFKEVVQLAAEKQAYSVGAALLKTCPLNNYTVHIYPYTGKRKLAQACKDQGLMDWALLMRSFDWKYVQEHHTSCQNQIVIDFILERAVDHKRVKVIRELMPRCTDSQILGQILNTAIKNGVSDIAEAVMCQVDPATVINHDINRGKRSLLYSAVASWSEIESKLNVIRLCIASGLSSFQRDITLQIDKDSRKHNCPLLKALGMRELQIVKLMLACGACTHRRLDRIRRDNKMQRYLGDSSASKQWKTGFRYILDAAATPSRLEHIARLTISHNIGCQPGRSERIESLPVPVPLKDLLRFKDVLSADYSQNSDEDV